MKLKSVMLIVYLFAGQALAQNRISLTEADGFVNAKAGGTIGTSINFLSYGFSAGYRAIPKFERIFLGAMFDYAPITRVGANTTDFYSAYGILAMYHFVDENAGFVAGLNGGLFRRAAFNGFFIKPVVQYHYPLFDFLSTGVEVDFDIQFRTAGVATPTATLLVNGALVLQYWF